MPRPRSTGFTCDNCGHEYQKVKETRPRSATMEGVEGVYRYRECLKCGSTFGTKEIKIPARVNTTLNRVNTTQEH